MPAVTVNGTKAFSVTVEESVYGSWTADLMTDAREALSGSATIELDGVVVWTGVVHRGDVWLDAARYRIVGARIGATVSPRAHSNAPASIVLADILSAAGLVQSPTVAPALLARRLTWVRPQSPASSAIANLSRVLGVTWRVLRDGTVWLGTDTYETLTIPRYDLTENSPAEGRFEIATDAAELLPSVTFRGRRVERVSHSFESGRTRSIGWWSP